MMSAFQLASTQSRTLAVNSLDYDLAAMDVNSKGQLICHFLAAHASLDNMQQHLQQCPAPKLTKTQAATLAYLWRKGVYHDDARSNIYRLLSGTLPTGCQADTAVESLLASVLNWTPGHPLLFETKECFEPVHAGEP